MEETFLLILLTNWHGDFRQMKRLNKFLFLPLHYRSLGKWGGRILNIFEGAAEIQAHVIARGLLDRRN